MAKDYLPQSNTGLLNFSVVFRKGLEEMGESLGVSQALREEYGAVQGAYAAALARTQGPDTRGPMATSRKDEAKAALADLSRRLGRSVDGYCATTDEQRRLLGLTVRGGKGAAIGRPTTMPVLDVVAVRGQVVEVALRDADTTLPRPKGVRSAWLYSFVGDVPPGDVKDWKFEGGATRSRAEVVFPGEVRPGSVVWVVARWVNTKDEPGPACGPVRTRINYMGLNEAA